MGPLNSHDFSVFYITFSLRFSVPHFRLTPRVVRWPELLEGFQGIPRAQRSGSQPGVGEKAMLLMGFATWGTITRGKEVMFMDLFSRRIYFCEDSLFQYILKQLRNTLRWNGIPLYRVCITCVLASKEPVHLPSMTKRESRKSIVFKHTDWGKICNPSQRGTVYP